MSDPFAVWAPIPARVRVAAGEAVLPMARDDSGWWRAHRGPVAGESYGFLVDDDPAVLPDPRSRHQPTGVHGRSEHHEPAGFPWSDGEWPGRHLEGGVVYELHVGTFTPEGTLDSAIGRLPHLAELGVDFVELLPVNGFNGDHNWGYDGVLWFAVDDSYGGPVAYQRFVDACHGLGLAVIQDVVYNHLGPSGNYLPRFGPYLHDASSTSWGSSINLDEPEVRRYILDNAAMWMRDYHVDGLRLDAVHALVDTGPVHILRELADETRALADELGRPLTLIAESDLNDPVIITPVDEGGYGIDAQWSDDFHHAVHVALTGEITGYYADFEHLDALAKVLTGGFFHDGTYSSFRERNHGVPIDTATTPAWRLVVANQNHDQIGNRAAGDRLAATLTHDQLKVAAALTLAGPFTPMLFMGEEWAASTPWQFFTAHPEPELGAATAQGRIAEFARMGWDPNAVPDPQDPATFHNSKLNWDELAEDDHRDMFELYRQLIRVRRTHPALVDPDFTNIAVEHDDDARWIAIHRNPGTTTVANLSAAPVDLPYPGALIVSTHPTTRVDGDFVHLAPWSAAIIERT